MLEIEITESNVIQGGVEVFVRAWQDSVQIGFGKDGTVDIERFRFFNPPVLVDDSSGDIVRESTNELTGEITVSRYRENPEEALLQSLEQTIALVGKDDSNIIEGKVGNTTSTFYSNATGDGDITSSGGGSWTANRDGNSLGVDSIDNDGNVYLDQNDSFRHHYYPFDTSALPDTDTIDSAIFSTNHVGANEQNNDAQEIGVLKSTQTSVTSLTTSHWVPASYATEYAARKTIASINAQSNNTYTDWTLTDTSIIDATDITPFMLVIGSIIDDIDPSAVSTNYTDFYFSDETGTTKDPKLVVEHSAGAGPTTNNSARRMHMMMM